METSRSRRRTWEDSTSTSTRRERSSKQEPGNLRRVGPRYTVQKTSTLESAYSRTRGAQPEHSVLTAGLLPLEASFAAAAEETLKTSAKSTIPHPKRGEDPMETEQEQEASTWEHEHEHECEKEAVQSKYVGINLINSRKHDTGCKNPTAPLKVRTRLAAQPLAAASRPASLTAAPASLRQLHFAEASRGDAEDSRKARKPLTLKGGKIQWRPSRSTRRRRGSKSTSTSTSTMRVQKEVQQVCRDHSRRVRYMVKKTNSTLECAYAACSPTPCSSQSPRIAHSRTLLPRQLPSLQAAEEALKDFCEEHGKALTLKEGKGPMGTDANRESYDDEAVASSGGDGLGSSCGSAEDKGDDAAKDADDSGESENLAGSDSDYTEAGENVDVHGCKYVGISWVEAEQKFRVRRNWKGTRHHIGR